MNEALAQFFLSGRAVDLAIAITVMEGVVLAFYHRVTGRGVAPKQYVLNVMSGLCLMLALRLALTGSAWLWVALSLSMSGVIHAVDMASRWQRSDRQPNFR